MGWIEEIEAVRMSCCELGVWNGWVGVIYLCLYLFQVGRWVSGWVGG